LCSKYHKGIRVRGYSKFCRDYVPEDILNITKACVLILF